MRRQAEKQHSSINNKSLVRWYKEEVEKDNSISNQIGLLSILSAQCLTYGSFHPRSEEKDKEYIEFLEYAEKNILNRKDMQKAIMQNWGQMPGIIRLGEHLREDREMMKWEEKEKTFSDTEREELRKLHQYIIGLRMNRVLSFAFRDDNQQLELPRTMPREHLEVITRYVYTLLVRAFAEDGAMTFRYWKKKGDTQIINGFSFVDKHIIKIDPKTLEQCLRMCPDGMIDMRKYNERYEEADI